MMEEFKDKKQPLTGVPLEKCRLILAPGTILAFKKIEYPLKKIMQDNCPEGSFAVARDIIGKYPKKIYMIFKSHEDFFRETADEDHRNFYEIILVDKPCTLYFDIEHCTAGKFNEDGSPSDDKLPSTIKTICEEAKAWWLCLAVDPSPLDNVVVTTASRMTGAVFKHSYHIVFPEIGFSSNSGELKTFAKHLKNLDTMQANNIKLEPTSLIDTSVYSKDQNLRIIESWKDNPNATPEMALEFYPKKAHTMDRLLETLATYVKKVTHWIPEPQLAENEANRAGIKRARTEKEDACRDSIDLTAYMPKRAVEDMQKLLNKHDSHGCDITGQVVESKKGPILRCNNQLPGSRQCLVTKGLTHSSNSAYCLMDGDYVYLRCHSEKCKTSKFCLGKSPASLLEWLFPASKRQKTDNQISGLIACPLSSQHIDSLCLPVPPCTSPTSPTPTPHQHCDVEPETHVCEDVMKEDTIARDNTTAMAISPTFDMFSHNVTNADLIELLHLYSVLNSEDPSQEDQGNIISILKKFGYRRFFDKMPMFSSMRQECKDNMWDTCDTEECLKDLNDVVTVVNTRLKARGSASDSTLRYIEKIYFARPSLSKTNQARVTQEINEKYLTTEILKSSSRVTVVESCTGTGKTTCTIKHAITLNMPIISVCERVTQVKQHVHSFREAGMRTKQYDDLDISEFQIGRESVVTTVDSLPKIRRILQDNKENAAGYILFLDELHSLTCHLLFSDTMQKTRKRALLTLGWLLKNAGKVIAMDNEITDGDLDLIHLALSEAGAHGPLMHWCYSDIAFVRNTYQKYSGTHAYYKDEAEMFAEIIEDMKQGKGFTAPCNTKNQAQRILRRLEEEIEDTGKMSNLKLYTSEEGIVPDDIDLVWSNSGIVYSPTITTGIDFNPNEAQSVYLFLNSENTISPAAALQMAVRNRNIKQVYICAQGMHNKPVYPSFEKMSTTLDALCQNSTNSRHTDILQQLQDNKINMKTYTCEYTETEFSTLYKTALFHDNVMRSSFLYMLDGLLERRGFQVIRQPISRQSDKVYNWQGIDDLNRQDKENDFHAWLAGTTPVGPSISRSAFFEKQLAVINGIKHSDIPKHTPHIEMLRKRLHQLLEHCSPNKHSIIVSIFTHSSSFEHNMNLQHAIYTDRKLHEYDLYNQANDYTLHNRTSINSKVQLLREMIRIFNQGMPADAQLKSYDLTLTQSVYEDCEKLEICDVTWNHYEFLHSRSTKTRPTTPKALMACIFKLACELFGKRFTQKTKINRNLYNYTTDAQVLNVCIEIADWSRRNLADIEPEIVQKYDLHLLQKNNQVFILTYFYPF
jgi:hypothetical protein